MEYDSLLKIVLDRRAIGCPYRPHICRAFGIENLYERRRTK
jgi:hypothetical protein